MTSRPVELVTNLRLTARTVVSHLREDPLLLVVQVSRRAPRRITRTLGSALRRSPGAVTRATGSWLLGDLTEARTTLAGLDTLPGRWAAELAVQLGTSESLSPHALDRFPQTAARAHWQRGDLSTAVATLEGDRPGTALRRRLASELRAATPGIDLQGQPAREPAPRAGSGAAPSVLHVLTNSLPHTQSGYAHRSHAVLTAQRDAGMRVAAATRLGYPVTVGKVAARGTDTIDGLDYHRLVLPSPGATVEERLAQTVRLLVPLAESTGADVLHATTNYTNGLVARAAARELGIPWVYEVRGLLEETWVASRPAGAEQEHAAQSEKYRLLRDRETEMAASADHVFTLSETLRDELVARGIDRESVSLVPNAVDAALLDGNLSPVEARRALGLPEDGFWVGTVTSLVDYEGIDTLLDGVAELRRRGVDARALVVGDGVSRGSLEAQAHRLGIDGVTLFPGRVPRQRALMYHQALDVFVVPRRDVRVCRLVTPLKPIEAMAYGRPVVASDLPALAELIGAPGSGLLAPAGDADRLAKSLEDLAGDPSLRYSLGERGRAFATTRTWDAVGGTYRGVMDYLNDRGRA